MGLPVRSLGIGERIPRKGIGAFVNAIPAVVEHQPGLVAAFDLPKITGKGLYKPE